MLRLLHAHDFQFQEADGHNTRQYAILSHTWAQSGQGHETSYDDAQRLFQRLSGEGGINNIVQQKIQSTSGFQKILKCRQLAAQDGWEWVWIDTCCIDKKSSSELQEAINSMFQWYESAKCCYVYLEDVSNRNDFFHARWFKRGWTLQELLASRVIYFFGKEWNEIGSKVTLASEISTITGIDEEILVGTKSLAEVSIARRMSWASQRETTRVEDTAYCLMGIFGVNMPLLYGEGNKAFIRLQEEIMRNSEDQTLLAWKTPETTDCACVNCLQQIAQKVCGALAPSPSAFSDSAMYEPTPVGGLVNRKPHAMTSRGLRIFLQLEDLGNGYFNAMLNCRERNGLPEQRLGIILRYDKFQPGKYYRTHAQELVLMDSNVNFKAEEVYIRQQIVQTSNYFSVRHNLGNMFELSVVESTRWNEKMRLIEMPDNVPGPRTTIIFHNRDSTYPLAFKVILGFIPRNNGNPIPACAYLTDIYDKAASKIMLGSGPYSFQLGDLNVQQSQASPFPLPQMINMFESGFNLNAE
ncbi:heterokaryon incompatibility protein-domain-containing protein [Xylogone sp. PMI_703]|nr:heterokaryon incompatibility protein-domain-containing protein [Xylogone sp. PMI_703]